MPQHFIFLVLAVIVETIGTTALSASQGFTRLVPSAIAILSFSAALYFLSLTLKIMPVGIVYAVWSGLGILFVTAMGFFWLNQKLDTAALLGIALILCGVIVINVFSNSVTH